MTNRQTEIHKRAIQVGQRRRMDEIRIIKILQEVEETKLYLEFGLTSVYQYAVEYIGLDEGVAYSFKSVALKAREFPELQRALVDQNLSVSKAVRIVSTLTKDNAKILVHFATTHSKRETEREVARINPKASGKNSIKQLSEDYVQLTVTIRRSTYEKMERAEEVHGVSRAETLDHVFEEHLERHDPVRKAKRAQKTEPCPGRKGNLNAAETHAVNARDEGQCTQIDAKGRRCPNKRWVETHHIIRRVDGGTNDLSNLTTLCRTHHQALHSQTQTCHPPRSGVIKKHANDRAKIWRRMPRDTGAHP